MAASEPVVPELAASGVAPVAGRVNEFDAGVVPVVDGAVGGAMLVPGGDCGAGLSVPGGAVGSVEDGRALSGMG